MAGNYLSEVARLRRVSLIDTGEMGTRGTPEIRGEALDAGA